MRYQYYLNGKEPETFLNKLLCPPIHKGNATLYGHHPLPTNWRSRFVKSEKVISNNTFEKARHTLHFERVARVRFLNEWNKSYLLYDTYVWYATFSRAIHLHINGVGSKECDIV